MNPYSRFGRVSNTVSAAIILSALAFAGPNILTAVETVSAGNSATMLSYLGGAVVLVVVFWIAMTEAIFPILFRMTSVRRLVLGKYYFEGTWLQSEKGEGHERLSVIDIQPRGKSFIFSGYSLNSDLEIESNTLIEFSKLDWPFMTYKYRNSLSDGADGKRDGVGEIQYEMNRAAARRYNGYVQYVRGDARLRIEGAKMTSNREVKKLRTLQGRRDVFRKYWNLFFNASVHRLEAPTEAIATPAYKPNVPVVTPSAEVDRVSEPFMTEDKREVADVLERYEAEAAVIDRRRTGSTASGHDGIVPRRRASDWAVGRPSQCRQGAEIKVGAKPEVKSMGTK